ncbi:MAG TPA: hypothetical protein VIY29_28580, partial [Ktedonobacteraceae bacterium]
MGGKSITFTAQSAQLPDIKELRPEYKAIYSQVLQDVLHRLDKAFKDFFRRVKSGEVPGYPRFRAWFRYDSLTYPQSGFAIEPCGPTPQGKNCQAKQWAKLTLAKIGTIWMNMHRPFKGLKINAHNRGNEPLFWLFVPVKWSTSSRQFGVAYSRAFHRTGPRRLGVRSMSPF